MQAKATNVPWRVDYPEPGFSFGHFKIAGSSGD